MDWLCSCSILNVRSNENKKQHEFCDSIVRIQFISSLAAYVVAKIQFWYRILMNHWQLVPCISRLGWTEIDFTTKILIHLNVLMSLSTWHNNWNVVSPIWIIWYITFTKPGDNIPFASVDSEFRIGSSIFVGLAKTLHFLHLKQSGRIASKPLEYPIFCI